MAYSILLFDADNTLFDFTRSEHDALVSCLVSRGLPSDEDTVAHYSAVNDRHWKMLERGEITHDFLRVSRFRIFFREIGVPDDPAAMAADYEAALSRQHWLTDGAEALCRALHGHFRMYLVTNGTCSIQNGRFIPTPIYPLFDGTFISEEIGFEKPQKAFFDAVAARIPGFDPARALIVGDSLTSDIQGGINAGIDTCWLNPSGRPLPDAFAGKVTYVVRTLDDVRRLLLG